jgi:SNF2 family DNA or RNA helicase
VRLDPDRRRELLHSLRAITYPSSGALLDASPAARALVAEELDRAERRCRNASAAPSALRKLHSLKRHLYPYQREGVERFLATGRLLLADDMGLGKTTQAIAACHALFESGRVARGLVIAPASLKSQWLGNGRTPRPFPLRWSTAHPRIERANTTTFEPGFSS